MPASAKILDDTITFSIIGFAQHHLGTDAAGTQSVAHELGMLHTDTKGQPGAPVAGMRDDFVAGAVDDIDLAGDRLKLLGNKLAAALANPGDIDRRLGFFR